MVVHELTSLPADLDLREPGIYDANNRIRREGTRNLLDAARAAGAQRVVAQSVAFVYEPVGGPVKSEADPVMIEVPGEFGTSLAATMDLERQVLEPEASSCATGSSTDRAPPMRPTAIRPLRSAAAAFRSSVAATGSSPSFTSTMRPRRR